MSAKSSAFPPLASQSLVEDLRTNSRWSTVSCLLTVDLLTLLVAYGLPVLWRHQVTPSYSLTSYLEIMPTVLLIMCAFGVQGLYPGALFHPAEEIRRIFTATTAVFLIMASATFLWRSAASYSRSVFLLTWLFVPPFVLISRHVARSALSKCSWWGVPAVVLGTGPAAKRVLRTLAERTRGIRVVGVLTIDSVEPWPPDLPPILGDLNLAPKLAQSKIAQYAIIAMPERSNLELRHAIQDYCHGFGHVLIVPDMMGLCSLGIVARDLSGEVGLELPQRLFHRHAFVSKRAMDIFLATAAISLLLPVFFIVTFLIMFSANGPIFYSQKRYGKHGKLFRAWKFRTMVPNADTILADHLAANPEQLFEWQRDQKLKNDPRVTTVGKFLRRFSLDELPQLVNVLAGHMSLVGPRPIVSSEISKYGRGYVLYQRVLPGITGLWQVSGRNNTTYKERVALDEFYAENWSVWLDLYILVRTVKVVLTAHGSY